MYKPRKDATDKQIQDNQYLTLTVNVLETVILVWEGLRSLANICPIWAQHTDLENQTNISYHRLTIHTSKSLRQIFSYYTLFQNLYQDESNTLSEDTYKSQIINIMTILDAARQCIPDSTYVPLDYKCLDAQLLQLDLKFTCPNVTEDISKLLEPSSSINETQLIGQYYTEQPQLPSDVISNDKEETLIENDNSSYTYSTNQDTGVLESILNCLEPETTEKLSICSTPDPYSSTLVAPVLLSTRKRMRTFELSSSTSSLSSNDQYLENDLTSPCQGVCWDPTHQRWVAHWSDARTHQRIRRYFSPKIMGFKHARLLAMFTRKDAVESGRASMTAKCDRLKMKSQSNVSLKNQNEESENTKGLYWCAETHQWYCYWKTSDSEDLHASGFPVSDYLNQVNQNFDAAYQLARMKAVEYRHSILKADKTTISNDKYRTNETITRSGKVLNYQHHKSNFLPQSTANSVPSLSVYTTSDSSNHIAYSPPISDPTSLLLKSVLEMSPLSTENKKTPQSNSDVDEISIQNLESRTLSKPQSSDEKSQINNYSTPSSLSSLFLSFSRETNLKLPTSCA